MLLSEILYEGEYRSEFAAKDISFSSLVTDTSECNADCVFLCRQGQHFDTHKVLPYLIARSPRALLVKEGTPLPCNTLIPVFFLPDPAERLPYLFARFSGDPQKKMKIIGITGTNGKTSTAYFLHALLTANGYRTEIIGTVTSGTEGATMSKSRATQLQSMTTPPPEILYPLLHQMHEGGAEYVIMEVSSHALAQGRCAPIFFTCGIFTNLSPEHLDFHSDMEAYFEAKRKLFFQCEYGLVNIDDPYGMRLLRSASPCPLSSYGCNDEADFSAKDIHADTSEGISYRYDFKNTSIPIQSSIPGAFTVYNTLASLAAGSLLGLTPEALHMGIAACTAVPGRMERIDTYGAPFSVWIDYAHTARALQSFLSTVRSFTPPDGRLILLFGCGGDRDREKRKEMGTVAEVLADFVILTTDNSRSEEPLSIIRDILSGMKDPARRRVIPNRAKAIRYAIEHARPKDRILLCGKGHESGQSDCYGIHPFEEREIVRKLLQARSQKEST